MTVKMLLTTINPSWTCIFPIFDIHYTNCLSGKKMVS